MSHRPDPRANHDPGRRMRPLLWAALVVMGALILVLMPSPDRGTQSFAANPQVGGQALEPLDGSEQITLDRFSEVAAFATDAVVRIESRSDAPAAQQQQPAMPDLFEPFFGPGMEAPRQMPRIAGGSGFIVSEDGRILTNAHVVQGGDLTVYLDDRRSFPAELVGIDQTTDVAVLDIEANGLPTLPLGDSDDLRVGEWVMAIGSPGVGGGQLEQTVTAGIVSALERPLELVSQGLMEDPQTREFAAYAIENFIQTDAAINPGNSGGPLVDLNGRVVGINTAIASPTGYFLGYGFAVPSNLATGVAEDLVEYGEVRRAQLGINVTTVSPEDAEYFVLDEVRGVLVQGTTEGGPAAEAGLQQGDVILAVEGDPIDGVGELQQEVAERTPGDEVELTVVRDGEEQAVSVVLGETELPGAPQPATATEPEALDRLGLALGDLTPARRSQLGLEEAVDGAVVVQVSPLSSAARKGVREGDVITEVGGEEVTSPSQVAQRLGEIEGGEVTSLVVLAPGGAERIVTLRVPA
jgi:serine protease Do